MPDLPPDQRAVRTLLVVGVILIATGVAGSALGPGACIGCFGPGGVLLLLLARGTEERGP